MFNQTTGDLKSHHLQARVTALSVPPSPPFISAVHIIKIFKGTHTASWGGGGARAPQALTRTPDTENSKI